MQKEIEPLTTVKIGTSTTMLSPSTGRVICPDSSLSNVVIEEKKCDDNDFIESSHPQECSEPTPNYSSTYTSMAALQNIAVSKSAPHSIISSSSCFDNSNCERSSIQSHPYETYSGPCYSIDINHKSDTELTLETRQNSLRRGKWTREEEEYANAVVKEFNSGYLDAQPGTTLRIYLSEKLRCDPMRITKKFTGHDSIGKRVFHPTGRVGDGLTREARHAQVSSRMYATEPSDAPITFGFCVLNACKPFYLRQILNSFITNGRKG